jgi:hypothetical protein
MYHAFYIAMKNRYCLIVLCSLFAATDARAQLFGAQVGVKTGVAVTGIHEAGTDYQSHLGYAIGASAAVDPAGPFTVQVDALVNQRGATYTNGPAGTAMSHGVHEALYLDVPVTARLHLPLAGAVSPMLLAGPYTAVKLWERTAENGAPAGNHVAFRNIDTGFVLGGGLDFDLRTTTLHTEVRYQVGMPGFVEVNGLGEGRHGGLLFLVGLTL